MADRVVAAPVSSHGGRFSGKPRIIVIHSVESEAKVGLAYSLATGWLQHEKVSIHAIADPTEVVRMVPIDTIAYHCGSGNSVSLGIEHAGRASWTFDQWISGDSHQRQPPGAFDTLRNGARVVAEWCKALGIPRRWLTPAEAASGARGLATHNTMRLAFGGTTHTDPGAGFPYAIYLKMVQQFAGDILNPDAPPVVTPGQQTGGAEEEDDMAYIFFTYPEVGAKEDGTRGSRVFVSDGVFFRHVEDMENLAHEVWRLRSLGVTPKYVSDSKFQLTEVPDTASPADAANTIATAKWVTDPHAYGRDFAELLPK
jgi:hypothetical protein